MSFAHRLHTYLCANRKIVQVQSSCYLVTIPETASGDTDYRYSIIGIKIKERGQSISVKHDNNNCVKQ